MITNFSRRSMLTALGLGAAAPFVPLLEADAEAGAVPRRLILMYHPFGTLRDDWIPDVQSAESFSFENKYISESLESIKQHIVMLDGVRMRWRDGTASYDGDQYSTGDQHQKGMGTLWTGSRLLQHWETTSTSGIGGQDGVIGRASGKSVDQHIVEALAPDTVFGSLQFGVDVKDEDEVRSRMIYSGSDAPITPMTDPIGAWETVFEPFSGDLSEVQRLNEQRRSIYDLADGQLDRIRGRVGADDLQRIDAHLDALDTLRARLDTSADCGDVPRPEPSDVSAHRRLPEVAQQQIDLMIRAMACDLTRVASLQIKDEHGGFSGWLTDDNPSFHSLSHQGGSGPLIRDAYRDFTELFVHLVQRLAETPEGEGSMLDNTVVCWGSAIGHGSHTAFPTPFVLAGGGSTLQTGRFLAFDEIDHHRILVSLCRLMGVDAESFGNLDEGSGPVPGLLV